MSWSCSNGVLKLEYLAYHWILLIYYILSICIMIIDTIGRLCFNPQQKVPSRTFFILFGVIRHFHQKKLIEFEEQHVYSFKK